MVREHGPGDDAERAPPGERRQPRHEVRPVGIIPEDELPLEAPHHHMVDDPRHVQAWLARHG